jgi:hypothetical protein
VGSVTWTKLGDEYPDQALELSDAAFRLHTEALCWSNKTLADLVIPKKFLPRVTGVAEPQDAANELVEFGWWQDVGLGYYIGCRFPDWQQERSVVEHRQRLAAERMRRHRLHKAGDHTLCTENCSVTRNETRHAMRNETRSPGTGRDGTGLENQTAKASFEEEKESSGTSVEDGERGGAGPLCPECSETSWLLARDGVLRCRRHHFEVVS